MSSKWRTGPQPKPTVLTEGYYATGMGAVPDSSKLEVAIAKLISALNGTPNLRMMTTESAGLIYDGITNVRMAVLGALNSFITPPEYVWDDFRVAIWTGYRDMYTGASSSPPGGDDSYTAVQAATVALITANDLWPHYVMPKMTPYKNAILAARSGKKLNVTFPDYGFTTAVIAELTEALRVLKTADALKQVVPTDSTGWVNTFWNGLQKVADGLHSALGVVIDLGRGFIGGLSFLWSNWLPILVIGGYLWYSRGR